jgi:hypothetical protein
MPLLEIYFFGLISHTGTDKKAKRSVLVSFKDHNATIFTSTGDKEAIQGGAPVRFKGLGSEPTLSPFFRDYMPSLKETIRPRQDLRDDVKTEKNNKEVQGFVHLPAGDFGIADFYKQQATLYLDSAIVRPKNCVGRLALLTCIVNAASATIRIGKKSLTLPLPGWVLFTNASNGNTKDFHAYRLITTAPDDTYIATVTEEADPCSLWATWHKGTYYDQVAPIVNQFRDATQVECTNTRFP